MFKKRKAKKIANKMMKNLDNLYIRFLRDEYLTPFELDMLFLYYKILKNGEEDPNE